MLQVSQAHSSKACFQFCRIYLNPVYQNIQTIARSLHNVYIIQHAYRTKSLYIRFKFFVWFKRLVECGRQLVFLPALGFLEFQFFFAEEVDELTVKLVVFLSQALYIVIKQPLEFRNPTAEICSDQYPVFLKILKGLNRKEACSCYNATFDSSQKPHVLRNASLPLETKFTLNNFVCCI